MRPASPKGGWKGRVQWTGHQSDAEVAADFSAIDVLVMPYEDGMSMRTQHIDGCAGQRLRNCHHAPPDPDAGTDAGQRPAARSSPRRCCDAAAVTRIAEDAGLAANLRANARRAARQFRWDVIAARHLEIYHG